MVYKFKIITDENDKFSMDIEIKSTQTFFDFHSAIQDEAGWDNSQLASFFLCNSIWEKEQEISLLDMSDGANSKTIVMDKAVLIDYVKELKQKLIYVFDFFNDRCFFIELVEIKPVNHNRYYPVCTNFVGDIPPQIKLSRTNSSRNIFADEFEDEDNAAFDEITDEDLDGDLEDSQFFEEEKGEEEEEKY